MKSSAATGMAKVTVPHEDFLAKIRAVRYAFLELGVDEGVIVARTDSLGAGLTKQIAVTHEVGDLGDQYNSFLDLEELEHAQMNHGDVIINYHGKLVRPRRLPSNLYRFRKGTGEDRCVLDSITSLQNGADLLWIETESPHRSDRWHGEANSRGDSQRQAGVQQFAVIQLDPEFSPAGIRCLE